MLGVIEVRRRGVARALQWTGSNADDAARFTERPVRTIATGQEGRPHWVTGRLLGLDGEWRDLQTGDWFVRECTCCPQVEVASPVLYRTKYEPRETAISG